MRQFNLLKNIFNYCFKKLSDDDVKTETGVKSTDCERSSEFVMSNFIPKCSKYWLGFFTFKILQLTTSKFY